MKEEFLNKRLNERREQNAFRQLKLPAQKIDFCSNDYLGISARRMISVDRELVSHGSTGSRLLSGNYSLIEETEAIIAAFHQAEAGLIFNSGYDANLGLLSCVAQRGDTIIYDYLCHASIRDGIRLSFAHSFSFEHNDLNDLEKKLRLAEGNRFVVTESLFSMDGDMAPISPIVELCKKYSASLIVDEAHATGVVGDRGEGLIQQLGLEADCFARVHTFGKAVGCHGANDGAFIHYFIEVMLDIEAGDICHEFFIGGITVVHCFRFSLHSGMDMVEKCIDMIHLNIIAGAFHGAAIGMAHHYDQLRTQYPYSIFHTANGIEAGDIAGKPDAENIAQALVKNEL